MSLLSSEEWGGLLCRLTGGPAGRREGSAEPWAGAGPRGSWEELCPPGQVAMLVPALLGLVQFLLLVQPPSTHLHPQPGINDCAWSEQLCRLSVDKCLCRCLGVCLPGIVSLHGEDFAILSISVPSSWHRMSRRSWDPGQRAGGWAGCCHPLPTQKNREGLSPCPRPWPQPQPQEVTAAQWSGDG